MEGFADYPPRMRSIGAILADKARRHGDRTYFYHDGSACTYGQLEERANRLAAGLFSLGVVKGTVVCSLLNSSPDYLALWFGLSKAGAVEVPINTAYKGYLLEYILSFTEAETLILEEEYLERVAAIQEKLPRLKRLIVRGAGGGSANPTRFEALPFERLREAGDRPPEVTMEFSDPCAIVFTSGTTGPSKGAVIPVNFNYRFATRHAEIMRYTADDVLYNFLPFFHVAGKFQALAAMLVGGKMVLQEKFSVSRFWEEVRRYGVTGFLSVGGILHMLNSQPPRPDDSDNPIRKIYAVPIPKEFRAEFERRFGVTMQEAYGATEDGLVLSTVWEEPAPPGSCGRPCDLYEVDVLDENDMPCPAGVPGEIVVRSREPYAMMSGYFKMPEATLAAFRNLWFHTGDRGVKDEKGWFFFLDRMKDAIRRRGENISSYEVERVINAHPKVAESAVIPVPSEVGEDEVKAVVILKEGETLDPAELVAFCEANMARFAVPRYVEYIPELPRTPTQKVEKYKLRNAGVTPSTWDREKAGYKLER
jgi:crotonobetaine/carnitine-CoA ligase